MNPAEVATALLIERTLQDSPAYRKIDDSLYVIKQGSAYVMISVVPWGDNRAMVRCTSQLVKGLDVEELVATLRDVALIADEYDDKLMKKYGGQRMIDLLEEAAMERIMEKDPKSF